MDFKGDLGVERSIIFGSGQYVYTHKSIDPSTAFDTDTQSAPLGSLLINPTTGLIYRKWSMTDLGWVALGADRSLILNELTGFTNNENIVVTYNSVSRTVTLTGTFKAFYHGTELLTLVNGWESDPHAENPTGTLFLKYNGSGFEWSNIPWKFTELQIAYSCYTSGGSFCFAQREVHGFMQWQTHKELHEVIGTHRISGGALSDYTIGSTTLKYPDTSQCVVDDEDLESTLAIHNNNLYAQMTLTGASGVPVFALDQATIVPVSTNRPYYNQFTGGTWQQTLMSNNSYAAVWQIAIPVTADAQSQKHRFVWIQGQHNDNLTNIQALTTSNLNLGQFTDVSPEFVFINKVIIQYTGVNWSITQVDSLTGTRYNQISSPSGLFLANVAHDTTLTGEGTSGSPLAVSQSYPFNFTSTITTTGRTRAINIFTTSQSLTGTETYDQVILDGSANAIVFALPIASTNLGRCYTITASDITFEVRVDVNLADTITNIGQSFYFSQAGQSITITVSGVNNWQIT